MADHIDSKFFDRFFTKEVNFPTNIPVCGRDELFYNDQNPKRGIALIFNHQYFDDKDIVPRDGTIHDKQALKATLSKLDFDVRAYDDLDFGDIYEIITKVAKEDHSENDCFVLCIMSHGEEGKINAKDFPYSPNVLWKKFTGDNCPSLAGKPKLFFIQACRGSEIDDGATVKTSRTQADSSTRPDIYKIPAMADILIMYSTFEGYFSWRSPDRGSWFIQALCNQLNAHSDKWDLISILTFVNRLVAVECQSNVPEKLSMHHKKQVCTIMSTLTRFLKFPPKNNVETKPAIRKAVSIS